MEFTFQGRVVAYPYKGVPIDKVITRELMCELFVGEDFINKTEMREQILERHLKLGGLQPKIDLEIAITNILSEFKKEGVVETHPNKSLWKVLSNPYSDDNIEEKYETVYSFLVEEAEFLDNLLESIQERRSKIQKIMYRHANKGK